MKITLPFVNDGKPFELPVWTVERHEKALNLCLNSVKDLDAKQQDKEFRFYVILTCLQEFDSSVTIKDVKTMHVDDMLELFEAIYYSGKRGIVFQEKPPAKK